MTGKLCNQISWLVIKITRECLFHQSRTIASDFDNEAITLSHFYFVPIIYMDRLNPLKLYNMKTFTY